MQTIYTFTVSGNGRFPLDMLRYDQCWPSGDSSAIETPEAGAERREQRELRLASHRKPTVERWRSFGWVVTVVQRNGVTLITSY